MSAYNGAAPAIESKDVLAAAGSSDGGFDKALDMQAVLKAVQPFVRS